MRLSAGPLEILILMRYDCNMKKSTSIRINEEVKELLLKLAQKWGISQSDVLELVIWRAAEQKKL